MCVCVYIICVVVVKEKEWRCVRSACVSFFCLQMKKKSLDFLFGGHLEKKREKGREKREIFSREISSVLLLSLVALLINSLERTKAREIREEL